MQLRTIVVGTGLAIGALVLAPSAWEALRFEPLPANAVADRVVVDKAEHTLTLLRDGVPLKRYRISLGPTVMGAKRFEGDGQTPEGRYVIDSRLSDSRFHRALHLSYPSASEQAYALAHGRSAGHAILIHGLRSGLGFMGPLHRAYDWTDGCLAVTNREIDELWRAIPDGTPIEIRASAGAVAREPQLPFYDWGACPFECCTYREWTANGLVDLFEDIDSSERLATVAQGDRVIGVTGVVITRQAGHVEVLEPVTLDEQNPVHAAPGDVLYRLHYTGEGHERFWYRGELHDAALAVEPTDAWKVVDAPAVEWWVQVRMASDVVGWTKETDRFDHKDACE